MSFTIGSLFDGSGGFPLSAFLCGGTPIWASEIEPYPIAVTKTRFPYMKHLGSVTDIKGNEVEPVDVISFGSPCQDLSVAGKRAGLKHEDNGDDETTRSGLFMEAVRIIKEMREATNGRYPTFALWENVPGAFSSNKGEDFRTVLEELVKIVEPSAVMPKVPKNGWAYADCYMGDGWSLAYRTFDAQYWGVPQRRRRIYLVLDLRGERADKVLFEREGLRGYFAEGRTPWQAVTLDAERGIGTADNERNCVALDGYNQTLSEITQAIRAAVSDGDHVGMVIEEINHSVGFCPEQSAKTRGIGYEEEESPTLRAGVVPGVAYTLKIRSGCEGGGKGALVQDDKSATLSTLNDQYLFQPMVAYETIALEGNGSRPSHNGDGYSVTDKMYTLNTIDRHAVCYGICSNASNSMKSDNPHSGIYEADTARTIDQNGGNPSCNQGGIAIVEQHIYKADDGSTSDVAPTLVVENPVVLDRAFYNQGQNALYEPQYYDDGSVPTIVAKGPSAVVYMDALPPVPEDVKQFINENNTYAPHQQDLLQDEDGVARTLACGTHASGSHLTKTVIFTGTRYIVRRLTPTECARLQGFMDGWATPDKKDSFTDEEYEFWLKVRNTHAEINGKAVKDYTKEQMLNWYNKLHTDSSEYKLWGNGIALPNALYVMQGIADVFAQC